VTLEIRIIGNMRAITDTAISSARKAAEVRKPVRLKDFDRSGLELLYLPIMSCGRTGDEGLDGVAVTRRMRAMGIRDRPITPRSPWQNGHVERLIGSVRRDCLDHVVVLGESHFRRLLANYTS
jgi:Integrase core domain